jgi:hypothetical protein
MTRLCYRDIRDEVAWKGTQSLNNVMERSFKIGVLLLHLNVQKNVKSRFLQYCYKSAMLFQ